jgi:hypothetical protein
VIHVSAALSVFPIIQACRLTWCAFGQAFFVNRRTSPEVASMAHNIGQMFYCGELPWHGLGQKLPAPATIDQALAAGGPN